jgi:ferredoxin
VTIRELAGCEVVLCSKVGYEPWGPLEAAGMQPNGEHAMEPIEEAAAVYAEMHAAGKLDAKPLCSRRLLRRRDHGLRNHRNLRQLLRLRAALPESGDLRRPAPHFLIDPEKCTECIGDYMDAQCSSICPIEGAILDELGRELNPPGSLTGISPTAEPCRS